MNTRTTIGSFCLTMAVLLGIVFFVSVGATADAAERPNIILVMADDMGFSDLGCYGSEIKTPTIDQLAKEGVRFSQFYNCNLCGPSRGALMTGCYPWQVGPRLRTNVFANLEKNCVTVMELLKANGYETCVVGRPDVVTAEDWHNPAQLAKCADRFLCTVTSKSRPGPGNYYQEVTANPWYKDGRKWERPVGAYSTDLISDFVVDFIEGTSGQEKPFFAYVSHFAPHWPLQADEKDIAPYRKLYENADRTKLMQARLDCLIQDGLIPKKTKLHPSALNAKSPNDGTSLTERMAIHAAMVESIDHSLADIMASLKKAGQFDNTLILVLSDNGSSAQLCYNQPRPQEFRAGSVETFINHGAALAALNNTPFRDYKTSDYEGGIASPLVAWWPNGLEGKGRISHRLSHIADIMPTCLELAGVAYPKAFEGRKIIPLAGKSFVSVLRGTEGDQDADRVIAWPKALREGDWKLMLGKKPELYHISKDRNETKNLAVDFPEQIHKMKELHSKLFSVNSMSK
jgi:arylsulfatase A-like enzyme